jgi:hypothetical protein
MVLVEKVLERMLALYSGSSDWCVSTMHRASLSKLYDAREKRLNHHLHLAKPNLEIIISFFVF